VDVLDVRRITARRHLARRLAVDGVCSLRVGLAGVDIRHGCAVDDDVGVPFLQDCVETAGLLEVEFRQRDLELRTRRVVRPGDRPVTRLSSPDHVTAEETVRAHDEKPHTVRSYQQGK